MSRARATALALVNWKGVFYERYLLDRHVTVLEGANGAGKTTVMIAAYVVLLPDMTRLRFTNLGETAATGGDRGIWGRLGELGRPSYAAIEILAGGERVIAGVHLERKAEPTIELTPFLISGVDLSGHLKQVLLATEDEHDAVPQLSDVRDAVTARGGELTVFGTAKEYFAALFDRGINPLRLATDEERHKMNEMLRTSMTGGISKALTTELRPFLLREETGLADTLSRMRQNLDTCQRTRIEVTEARNLEREIAGVFDAGRSMFSTALQAVRESAREEAARAERARRERDEASRALRELDRAAVETAARLEAVGERLEAVVGAQESARAARDAAARATATQQRIRALSEQQDEQRRVAGAARAEHEARSAARDAQRAERDRARAAYERAARGASDLQTGLDELHRAVHQRRLALRRLEEIRQLSQDAHFHPDGVDAALARARSRMTELDRERAHARRDLGLGAEQRRRYQAAAAALARLVPGFDPAKAHDAALSVAGRSAELDAAARRIPELAASLERHVALRDRQAMARDRAEALGVELVDGGGSAAARISAELDRLDAEARAHDARARELEERARELQRHGAETRARMLQLEGSSARWSACRSAADELAKALDLPIRSLDDALAARARVTVLLDEQRAAVADLRARRERSERGAAELDAARGSFHPDLLRIRDELGAELLAGRFEDLDPGAAAALEAELGPLANALVVEDPLAAARSLADAPREVRDLWLVRPDAELFERLSRPSTPQVDVVVEEAYGVRLTRMPERPSIGRLARERRAAEMRAEADRLGAELELALQRQKQLDGSSQRIDYVVAEAELLEREAPAATLERLRAEATAQDLDERSALDAMGEEQAHAAERRARGASLRGLLGEAFLLDPPDHAEEATQLADRLRDATAARDELARTAEDRRTLAEGQEELRGPPPGDGDPAAALARAEALDVERDRVFALTEALEDLAKSRPTLVREDAEQALEAGSAIAPALQAELDQARQRLTEAEDAVARADLAWDEAAKASQARDASLASVTAQIAELRAILEAEGLTDLSSDALGRAEHELSRRAEERRVLEVEERALSTEVVLLGERRTRARKSLEAAEESLARRELEAAPAHALWVELEKDAAAHGLVTRTASEPETPTSSTARWSEAWSKAQVLLERMRRARGGIEGADAIERALATERTGGDSGPMGVAPRAFLAAWLATREWLERRLPLQVSEVADPLEALVRLRDQLALLEGRLSRQETDLRGASEDVARGIDVRLRRAKAQVRRLNQSLRDVRFGNIASIRIEMRRVERMDAVLRALRDGSAQEFLFVGNLPIEEALEEVFRRYGGGKSGGHKILDYREYAELVVEIQRNASAEWEPASPTRLSTGEAIGVGAALMMVVLTEWERDGNLLRPQKPVGSLRFLFLDEANRLSQDNLGALFSLCSALDLQLLIAAPEVARAEGNTTYRLVRHVGEDGREEVLVSGRRTVADASPP